MKTRWSLGVTQYTSRKNGWDLPGRAGGLGFQGAEPMIARADSEYLAWSSEDVRVFLDRAKEAGILIPTVAVAIFNEDPGLIDGEGKDRAVGLIRRCVEFTAAVGAKVMLLCTYFATHPDTVEKKDNLLAVLKEVLPMVVKANVNIALESPLPAQELVRLADALGSPRIGVYYDVGNAIYHGYDPAKEIEALGSRIMSVHVKDTDKMLGDSHLGKGRLNLAEVFHALAKINYDGWLFLETPPDDSNLIREDLQILKAYVQKEGNSQ